MTTGVLTKPIISYYAILVKRTSNDTREGLENLALTQAIDRFKELGHRYTNAEILSYVVRKNQEIEFMVKVG